MHPQARRADPPQAQTGRWPLQLRAFRWQVRRGGYPTPSAVGEFGVPDTLFGPVPEQEYRLVGRIVTIAALVEVNLYDLLTELEQVH